MVIPTPTPEVYFVLKPHNREKLYTGDAPLMGKAPVS
jgi:hypothetical protein